MIPEVLEVEPQLDVPLQSQQPLEHESVLLASPDGLAQLRAHGRGLGEDVLERLVLRKELAGRLHSDAGYARDRVRGVSGESQQICKLIGTDVKLLEDISFIEEALLEVVSDGDMPGEKLQEDLVGREDDHPAFPRFRLAGERDDDIVRLERVDLYGLHACFEEGLLDGGKALLEIAWHGGPAGLVIFINFGPEALALAFENAYRMGRLALLQCPPEGLGAGVDDRGPRIPARSVPTGGIHPADQVQGIDEQHLQPHFRLGLPSANISHLPDQ